VALDPALRARLALPAVCAPMFLVTGPALVREACKAGLIGGIPRQNARTLEQFDAWLGEIRRDLGAFAAEHPDAPTENEFGTCASACWILFEVPVRSRSAVAASSPRNEN